MQNELVKNVDASPLPMPRALASTDIRPQPVEKPSVVLEGPAESQSDSTSKTVGDNIRAIKPSTDKRSFIPAPTPSGEPCVSSLLGSAAMTSPVSQSCDLIVDDPTRTYSYASKMKMGSMGKAIKSSESLKQLEQQQHTDETNQKFDRTSLSSTHPSNGNVRAADVFQKKKYKCGDPCKAPSSDISSDSTTEHVTLDTLSNHSRKNSHSGLELDKFHEETGRIISHSKLPSCGTLGSLINEDLLEIGEDEGLTQAGRTEGLLLDDTCVQGRDLPLSPPFNYYHDQDYFFEGQHPEHKSPQEQEPQQQIQCPQAKEMAAEALPSVASVSLDIETPAKKGKAKQSCPLLVLDPSTGVEAITRSMECGSGTTQISGSGSSLRACESNTSNGSGILRKGKWTVEEEEYTARLIYYFNRGLLQLPEGQTLRAYISHKLKCDPMRVTKKFTGACCIGKKAFSGAQQAPQPHLQRGEVGQGVAPEDVNRAKEELERLEKRFWTTLEQSEEGYCYRNGVLGLGWGFDCMMLGRGREAEMAQQQSWNPILLAAYQQQLMATAAPRAGGNAKGTDNQGEGGGGAGSGVSNKGNGSNSSSTTLPSSLPNTIKMDQSQALALYARLGIPPPPPTYLDPTVRKTLNLPLPGSKQRGGLKNNFGLNLNDLGSTIGEKSASTRFSRTLDDVKNGSEGRGDVQSCSSIAQAITPLDVTPHAAHHTPFLPSLPSALSLPAPLTSLPPPVPSAAALAVQAASTSNATHVGAAAGHGEKMQSTAATMLTEISPAEKMTPSTTAETKECKGGKKNARDCGAAEASHLLMPIPSPRNVQVDDRSSTSKVSPATKICEGSPIDKSLVEGKGINGAGPLNVYAQTGPTTFAPFMPMLPTSMTPQQLYYYQQFLNLQHQLHQQQLAFSFPLPGHTSGTTRAANLDAGNTCGIKSNCKSSNEMSIPSSGGTVVAVDGSSIAPKSLVSPAADVAASGCRGPSLASQGRLSAAAVQVGGKRKCDTTEEKEGEKKPVLGKRGRGRPKGSSSKKAKDDSVMVVASATGGRAYARTKGKELGTKTERDEGDRDKAHLEASIRASVAQNIEEDAVLSHPCRLLPGQQPQQQQGESWPLSSELGLGSGLGFLMTSCSSSSFLQEFFEGQENLDKEKAREAGGGGESTLPLDLSFSGSLFSSSVQWPQTPPSAANVKRSSPSESEDESQAMAGKKNLQHCKDGTDNVASGQHRPYNSMPSTFIPPPFPSSHTSSGQVMDPTSSHLPSSFSHLPSLGTAAVAPVSAIPPPIRTKGELTAAFSDASSKQHQSNPSLPVCLDTSADLKEDGGNASTPIPISFPFDMDLLFASGLVDSNQHLSIPPFASAPSYTPFLAASTMQPVKGEPTKETEPEQTIDEGEKIGKEEGKKGRENLFCALTPISAATTLPGSGSSLSSCGTRGEQGAGLAFSFSSATGGSGQQRASKPPSLNPALAPFAPLPTPEQHAKSINQIRGNDAYPSFFPPSYASYALPNAYGGMSIDSLGSLASTPSSVPLSFPPFHLPPLLPSFLNGSTSSSSCLPVNFSFAPKKPWGQETARDGGSKRGRAEEEESAASTKKHKNDNA